jgi:glycosyltransferase involved in cell wall biosynthesis
MAKVCVLATNHKAQYVRIYHRICLSLIEAGYEVDLVAQTDVEHEFADGIRFYNVGNYQPSVRIHPLQRVKRIHQATLIARQSNADIYQFYSPEFISSAITLRKRTGKPVIFDCMEDFESYVRQRPGIPWWLRPFLIKYTQYQLRRAGRNLDAIITADRGTETLFLNYARQTLTLHNFPILSLFPDVVRTSQPTYDLVYHGGLGRHYLNEMLRIDGALQARNRFVKWYLFGNMPEREWFLRELEVRGTRERFYIGERIPHDQVTSNVQKARIGIIPLPNLPKYHNNIPQKLFEFMAMRMPVVMSDLPPSRPFVGDGRCALLVKPGDPDAYAEAIIRLLDNAELCQQMGDEGRTRVEQEYNWESEALKLLKLYQGLIN